jgi:hypothetical protein
MAHPLYIHYITDWNYKIFQMNFQLVFSTVTFENVHKVCLHIHIFEHEVRLFYRSPKTQYHQRGYPVYQARGSQARRHKQAIFTIVLIVPVFLHVQLAMDCYCLERGKKFRLRASYLNNLFTALNCHALVC